MTVGQFHYMKQALLRVGLALVASVLWSGSTMAADVKIGYVSPAKVTEQAPQAEAARAKLEREFEPRNQELIAMRDELRELEEKLQSDGSILPDAEQQQLQREIVSLRRDLQRAQEAFREDLNIRRNEELAEIQRLIVQTIDDFARDQNYDLIVSDGVFFASESVDITQPILERLRADFQRARGGQQ